MVFTTEGLFEVAIESWPQWDLNQRPPNPFRRSNRLSYQAMSSARTQSQLCTATPISSFIQCPISFWLLPSSVATKVVISDPGHTECSKGVGCGEGGGCLALLNYIYSKLILPRNSNPNHLENVACSGINIQLCQMISNKDLTSKKVSNQECLKNISLSPEDHICYNGYSFYQI